MNFSHRTNLQEWLARFFTLKNNSLPVVLFLSLLPLLVWFNNHPLQVRTYDTVITGIATFDNVDVKARISLYYGAVFIFSISFVLLTALFYLLYKRYGVGNTTLRPWMYISCWGTLNLLLMLGQAEGGPGLEMPAAFGLTLLLWQLFRYVKRVPSGIKSPFFFLLLSLLSLSLAVFAVRLAQASELKLPFFTAWLIAVVISALLCYFTTGSGPSFRVPAALVPLFFFGHLSVLADELYMISNQHNRPFLTPDTLFFSGSALLLLSFILLQLFYRRHMRPAAYFKKIALPAVLSGLALYALYNPFVEQSPDMFELANPANGVMRLFLHGELPIVDALSSHVLSDIGFKPLYVLLNGYSNDLSFFVYDFLYAALLLLIPYYFLRRILRSAVLAFALVLLFPYLPYLVLGHNIFAAVPLLLLMRMGKQPDMRRLMLTGLSLLFLVLWRIDVAVSALAASGVLLSIQILRAPQRMQALFSVVKTAAVFLLISATAFVLLYIRNNDVYTNLLSAKAYFGTAQAHALTHLTHHPDRLFYLHYVVFPLLMAVLLLWTLYRSFYSEYKKDGAFLLSALLFFLVYYFANAQRGLVRHSFIEENEFHISSCLYLVTAIFVYWLYRSKKEAGLIFIFCVTVAVFSFSAGGGFGFRSLNETLTRTAEAGRLIRPQPYKINRVRGSEDFALQRYAQLKRFMDSHLPADATFADLSNSPMLYFYTERRVPSYFNQYLQNTVTDWLLEENVKKLRSMNVPLAIFSSVPQSWFDITDGVPNTIRYLPVTSYIYENYEPYAVLNRYYVWKKKDLALPSPDSQQGDTGIIRQPQLYDVRHYPYILGRSPLLQQLRPITEWKYSRGAVYDVPVAQQKLSGYLRVDFEDIPYEQTVFMHYFFENDSLGGFQFILHGGAGIQSCLLPVGAQYNWIYHSVTNMRFRDSNGAIIQPKSVHLLKREPEA
ncbi:MAG: hypothetical protein IBJ09_15045 [Bacteroidia bacterium]|nr:hypothetical protein [Bacteroidia bacterium]